MSETKSQNNTVYGSGKPPDIWSSADDGRMSVSVLGDSISTYAGYNNAAWRNGTTAANAVWYPNPTHPITVELQNVWWFRLLSSKGYSLCVNNSYSGSLVADENTLTRAVNLQTDSGLYPDIIIAFMGVNDYANNVPLDRFTDYYSRAVAAMKAKYDAQIYLCTFLPNVKYVPSGKNALGLTRDDYNAVIRDIAAQQGARLIDLAAETGINAENMAEYSIDRLHPNTAGMDVIFRIADSVIG